METVARLLQTVHNRLQTPGTTMVAVVHLRQTVHNHLQTPGTTVAVVRPRQTVHNRLKTPGIAMVAVVRRLAMAPMEQAIPAGPTTARTIPTLEIVIRRVTAVLMVRVLILMVRLEGKVMTLLIQSTYMLN